MHPLLHVFMLSDIPREQRFLTRFLKDWRNQLRAKWPPVKLSKQRAATGEEHELEVIQILEDQPYVGQRELARTVGISQSSICRIVKENNLHPYHNTLV
ncbi:hypothetical protein Zmor_017924 [Zophobas morio]|uniref:Uncharacterized protein n=1 Tax=Zophobas morio TaxID=2755281 RepID=A0AA38MCM6_9CUCU|nr:hypothetical protein Zmor_017924 [Zophobas morio]